MNQGSQIRCHFNEPFITIKMRNHHAELIQLGIGETPDQFSLEIQSIAVEDQSNLITLDDGVVLEIENRAPEICYDDMSGEPFDYFAKLHDWGIHGDLPVSPKTGCCQVDKLIGVR